MNILRATTRYEAWLGKRITLLPGDLERKHAEMAANVFPFLRATFYRWVELWAKLLPQADGAMEPAFIEHAA
jgi:uncharacterized protein (DUF2252 family)